MMPSSTPSRLHGAGHGGGTRIRGCVKLHIFQQFFISACHNRIFLFPFGIFLYYNKPLPPSQSAAASVDSSCAKRLFPTSLFMDFHQGLGPFLLQEQEMGPGRSFSAIFIQMNRGTAWGDLLFLCFSEIFLVCIPSAPTWQKILFFGKIGIYIFCTNLIYSPINS